MGDKLKRLIQNTASALTRIDYTDFRGNKAAAADWLKGLAEKRYLVSTQIYFAFGGAALLTLTASLVGWYSFDQVGNFQSRVNEGSVPEMSAAFGIAQHANTLVSAGPRLTTTTGPEDYNNVAASIAESNTALVGQLALLQGQHAADERFARMRTHVDSLTSNTHTIQVGMVKSFPRATRIAALLAEIVEVGSQLDHILLPAIDDQFFYAMTGYGSLDEPPETRTEEFSEEEFARYRHLSELQADVSAVAQILASAFGLSAADSLEPLRERLDAARSRIAHSLDALGDSELREDVEPLIDRLFELGVGSLSSLELLDADLRLAELQHDLLAENRGIAVDLLDEVDVFVGIANTHVEEAILDSGQAILLGKILLAALSSVSIGGAALIAWLFVGRILMRRLALLSGWMQRMAGGDLESSVELGGRDEVTEMAGALEVFRRHAIEVQRLNLVERLAEELQGKNDQLESALGDLQLAQNQIVAREKLAALGELTAGVAHEIRNPLNFVKNFSEVSEELIDELKEILEEKGPMTDERRGLIKEISGDITDNLERIRTHGNRADRIVHDMLMMGRDSSEWRPANINNLLDEHARLAYHSARAADPNFQLNIKQDLDPEVGEIEVIPQNLGRVFLNMVSNAGYATDEKRRIRPGAGDGTYFPTLWLTTRRGEERIEIRIRDNGNGIPSDVIDKIFNPFFTTKPTEQGTGLGLAMSNDIIREHGGEIRVETEPGEFTEMIVDLPLEPRTTVMSAMEAVEEAMGAVGETMEAMGATESATS